MSDAQLIALVGLVFFCFVLMGYVIRCKIVVAIGSASLVGVIVVEAMLLLFCP